MRRLWMAGLSAAWLLLFPEFAGAQATGYPGGVKPGKVLVTGENPVIRLLDKAGGSTLASASYWRIVWSPAGPGHVCYLTTGDGKSPGDLRLALVDNRKLYDFLTTNIMTTLDRAIPERPFKVAPATFVDSGQGTFAASGAMKDRRVTCKSARYAVTLVWSDFYEPFQLDTAVGGPGSTLSVCSLFIPAKMGTILLNGKKAPGSVYPQSRGPAQSSTAFLAFSESWVK
ncbi:MAG TPA: hypothetical protein VGS20_17665 [Candidatus Acidoferrales bacterium]|nr:hypothetical protein [Candidatus Acidoferrales bacterium]